MLVAALMLSSLLAYGQEDTVKKIRLQAPANVSGRVGGESHNSYVVRARKGQRMSVQISWTKAGDNKAEFTVARSDNFFNAEPAKFGRATMKGDRWSGKVPATRNYYIYVVGHPIARYKLQVTLK